MKTGLLLALVILSILPVEAGANNKIIKRTMQSRCRGDVQTLCPGLRQGRDTIGCLVTHARQVSEGCRAAMTSISCSFDPSTKIKAAFPCGH